MMWSKSTVSRPGTPHAYPVGLGNALFLPPHTLRLGYRRWRSVHPRDMDGPWMSNACAVVQRPCPTPTPTRGSVSNRPPKHPTWLEQRLSSNSGRHVGCAPSTRRGMRLPRGDSQCVPASHADEGVLRIMPSGDSLTQGIEGDRTWRFWLDQHLTAHAVPHDFVGNIRRTASLDMTSDDEGYRPGIAFDTDHDGWGGAELLGSEDAFAFRLWANRPNVWILQLGTNDIRYGNADAQAFGGGSPAGHIDSPEGESEHSHRAGDSSADARPQRSEPGSLRLQRWPGEPRPVAEHRGIPVTVARTDLAVDPSVGTHDGVHLNAQGGVRLRSRHLRGSGRTGPRRCDARIPSARRSVTGDAGATAQAEAHAVRVLATFSHPTTTASSIDPTGRKSRGGPSRRRYSGRREWPAPCVNPAGRRSCGCAGAAVTPRWP